MVKPTPDNVKTCLAELTAAQQVTIRGYIGTLRAEIKALEEQVRAASDPDPHAHYHGHEKCTEDHGHDHHAHGESHDHGHEHKKEDHDHAHSHDHEKKHDHAHGHDHEAKKHDHAHGHDHEKKHEHEKEEKNAEGSTPAWKKRALESGIGNDPMAAPFGGNWTSESAVDATDDKMKD